MKKLYEKDLDALEECRVDIYKNCTLEVWSASNNFALSVYAVDHLGNRSVAEVIPSDEINGITIEFNRLADGNIYAKHVCHGNDDFSPSFMDAHYEPNYAVYFIIIANDEVTVRMYD